MVVTFLVVLNHVVYRHLLFKTGNKNKKNTVGIMEDQMKINLLL
jgi:hypothetical protein